MDDNDTIARDRSMNMVLRPYGWVGATGIMYGNPPTKEQEPGGFAPLYRQIGTWIEIEPGKWVISD